MGTADLHPHPMLQGDDHEMSCEEDKHRAAAYAEGTVQIVLPKEATEVEKEKDHDKQLSSMLCYSDLSLKVLNQS